MSLAPSSIALNSVLGCFNHAETGACFEYIPSDKAWEEADAYPHMICLDGGKQVRYANVFKTVAYVVTDEDGNGQPVVEKWHIRHQWKR
jgi:hypothetical protein